MKNLYGIIRRLDYTLSDDDVRQIADEYIEKIENELYDRIFKIEFLKTSRKHFFEWSIHEKDFLRQITFKTYERSIFKNYKETLNFMDWNSI